MTLPDGVPFMLYHGDWRETLDSVKTCDVLMTDPPYSARTHKGERGLKDNKPTEGIDYSALTMKDVADVVESWAPRVQNWAVIFCDHIAFRWWERAWNLAGWMTFAPVIWYRKNAPPRFQGDGPASCVDYVLVARPRKKVRDSGSRPGIYHVLTQSKKLITGSKDLGGMRALVRDYTSSGDLIVDPFAGLGTTLAAAQYEGCRALGSEVDEQTWRAASKVLKQKITPTLRGVRQKQEQVTLFGGG